MTTPTPPRVPPPPAPSPPQSFNLNIDLPKSDLAPLTAANFFHCTHTGQEVVLSVGILDPQKMLDLIARIGPKPPAGAPPRITADISHRFFLTVQGFVMLRRAVDDMTNKLTAAGLLQMTPPQPVPEPAPQTST